MAGKQALALYFSAHWCPPCRGFTPQLAEWYMQAPNFQGIGGRESPFIWRPTMDSDLSNWVYGFIHSKEMLDLTLLRQKQVTYYDIFVTYSILQWPHKGYPMTGLGQSLDFSPSSSSRGPQSEGLGGCLRVLGQRWSGLQCILQEFLEDSVTFDVYIFTQYMRQWWLK